MFNRPFFLGCLLVALALSGCDDEPTVVDHQQPKPPISAALPADHPPIGGTPPLESLAPHQAPNLNWTLPDGWRQDPTPRPMREGTVLIGDPPAAELAISRLGGQFGDWRDNVNRWRGQIGLPPLDDVSSLQPQIVSTPIGDAQVVFIEGEDNATLVALIKREEGTWFFRLTGKKNVVAENQPQFERFLKSLKTGVQT